MSRLFGYVWCGERLFVEFRSFWKLIVMMFLSFVKCEYDSYFDERVVDKV